MNIALVMETTFDSNAGVQQYFKGLGRYLLRKNHEVTFLVPQGTDTGEFKGRIVSLGAVFNPPLVNTTSVPVGFYSSTPRVRKTLRDSNFDIIHSGLPVFPGSMGKVIRLAKCPVVGTYLSHSHGLVHRFLTYILTTGLMKTVRYIDICIAPNRFTAHDASHTISGKFHIVPLGVDMSAFRHKAKPIADLNDGRPSILYFGRLDKRKGVQYVIDALPIILKHIPNIHLIIAGDGPMRKELEATVSAKKLRYAVNFTGYIPEEDKARYYATADICVFPATHGECFGIVIVEALASGKIPVAFANEGYRSVLENLPEAIVPVGNTKELARRLIYYLTHPKQKKSLERKCLIEARKFDWNTVGPQIIELYQKARKQLR